MENLNNYKKRILAYAVIILSVVYFYSKEAKSADWDLIGDVLNVITIWAEPTKNNTSDNRNKETELKRCIVSDGSIRKLTTTECSKIGGKISTSH